MEMCVKERVYEALKRKNYFDCGKKILLRSLKEQNISKRSLFKQKEIAMLTIFFFATILLLVNFIELRLQTKTKSCSKERLRMMFIVNVSKGSALRKLLTLLPLSSCLNSSLNPLLFLMQVKPAINISYTKSSRTLSAGFCVI